jgi:hypothetical protein
VNQPPVTRLIACSVALCGFVVALLAGLAAGNPTDLVLSRALASLIACFALGSLVGAMADRTVRDTVASHRARNTDPAPDASQPQIPARAVPSSEARAA